MKKALILLVAIINICILTGCGETETTTSRPERAGFKNTDEVDFENEADDLDESSESDEALTPSEWDFEISPYGMPDLEVKINDGVLVIDDNHPELDAALTECSERHKDADCRWFYIYRCDDSIVSVREMVLYDDAEVSQYISYFYNYTTLGQELTLDNIGKNIIDNGREQLQAGYDYYKGPMYNKNTIQSVDEITEDVGWVIDANSIAFFVDSVPYRIFFEDNNYINPAVIYDGGSMYSAITGGNLTYDNTTVEFVAGSIVNPSEPFYLGIVGQDYNYLKDIASKLSQNETGYMKYDVYINNENEVYIFVNGYYQYLEEIESDCFNEYRVNMFALYELVDGELVLLKGRDFPNVYNEGPNLEYHEDADYYNYVYDYPVDMVTFEKFIDLP